MQDLYFGGAVRFEGAERLDIIDAERMQTLQANAVSAALGAILGEVSGVLSYPRWYYNQANQVLTILPFMAFTSQGMHGVPLADGKVSLASAFAAAGNVSLAGFAPTQMTPYIWCRRTLTQGTLENRRKSIAGDEVTVAMATEWVEGGALRLTNSPAIPPGPESERWFIIGRVTGWAAGTPTIRWQHVLDRGGLAPGASALNQLTEYTTLQAAQNSPENSTRLVSLADSLSMLANIAIRAYTSEWAFDPQSQAPPAASATAALALSQSPYVRGLKELSEAATTLEHDVRAAAVLKFERVPDGAGFVYAAQVHWLGEGLGMYDVIYPQTPGIVRGEFGVVVTPGYVLNHAVVQAHEEAPNTLTSYNACGHFGTDTVLPASGFIACCFWFTSPQGPVAVDYGTVTLYVRKL